MKAQTMALTELAHGISTEPGLCTTTTVLGCTAATADTNLFCGSPAKPSSADRIHHHLHIITFTTVVTRVMLMAWDDIHDSGTVMAMVRVTVMVVIAMLMLMVTVSFLVM